MQQAKIFAHAYQLSMLIFERTRTFPKYHRPTLGRRLEDASLDLAIFIRYALMTSNKMRTKRAAYLAQASERLDEIRIVAQISHDLNLMKPAAYNDLCELSSSVGKEIGGLLKFENKHTETLAAGQ